MVSAVFRGLSTRLLARIAACRTLRSLRNQRNADQQIAARAAAKAAQSDYLTSRSTEADDMTATLEAHVDDSRPSPCCHNEKLCG